MISTAIMFVCTSSDAIALSNTIGLFVEVACGAAVYIAVNLAMKNVLMFELIEKVKNKILHKVLVVD